MTLSPVDFRTPGQFIKALLDEKEWSQTVAAIVMGVDQSLVSGVLAGKRRVDATLALKLGEVFEMDPSTFLDLQKNYDLGQALLVERPDPRRSTRARLFGGLPIAEMITRGWLAADNIRDVPKVEVALARFFGVPTADEIEILPHAAKKTHVDGTVTPSQLAWLYRTRQIAEEMMVARYSPSAVRAAITKLSGLLLSVDEARHVPRILAEAGVRFVIVESIASAKIDGACFWLNDMAPVVAMSLRFDRVDNFWFVLRHELEHVLRGHGRKAIAIDTELDGPGGGTDAALSEDERVANEAAAEFCVPRT
jgi:HTH-type transcriptional regulator/antitoxin HigA